MLAVQFALRSFGEFVDLPAGPKKKQKKKKKQEKSRSHRYISTYLYAYKYMCVHHTTLLSSLRRFFFFHSSAASRSSSSAHVHTIQLSWADGEMCVSTFGASGTAAVSRWSRRTRKTPSNKKRTSSTIASWRSGK